MPPRLLSAAARIALLTLALALSTAGAARAAGPRPGYWCGVRAGGSVTLPSSTPSGFVNACQGAEHVLAPAGRNAQRSAFVLQYQSGHVTLNSFRVGRRTIFKDLPFYPASTGYSLSANGRTLTGSFTSSTSFVGTYQRGHLTRSYFAWWVGRRCSRYAPVFYSRCSG